MTAAVVNALSFDIEDWFHLVEIDAVADVESWANLPSIVERYTEQILETVGRANVKATFFLLGWVAERYPQLSRLIADEGHELGTHGYWHRKVFEMSPGELRDDLKRSIDVIEDQSGRKVLGFRAPSFSIVPGSEWALDVLCELGLKYDASLFPARRGHGGYPCQVGPHERETPAGRTIAELPASVMRLGPLKLPFAGGGYLRLLQPWLIRRGFDQLNSQGLPAVVYLHPRDFAADCPRVPMPLGRRLKCYTGLRTTSGKLSMLLARYRFDTCARVLGIEESPRPESADRLPLAMPVGPS